MLLCTIVMTIVTVVSFVLDLRALAKKKIRKATRKEKAYTKLELRVGF